MTVMERNDVVSLLRRLEIRRDARRDYLADAERLDALADGLFRQERIYEAEGAHYWALIAHRAAEAEVTDPEIRG